MPKVLNRSKDNIPAGSVFIGRPSKWGNPFIIGKDGTRTEVIAKYKNWIMNQPELLSDAKKELKGKDLVCYCSPKKCHGDILLEIANFDEEGMFQ
jgi:hypothetical protein